MLWMFVRWVVSDEKMKEVDLQNAVDVCQIGDQ